MTPPTPPIPAYRGNEMPIDRSFFRQALAGAAAAGVAEYIAKVSPARDLISQTEAYEEFGRARVSKWLDRGLVNPIRANSSPNSKRYYSRAEMMKQAEAERLEAFYFGATPK